MTYQKMRPTYYCTKDQKNFPNPPPSKPQTKPPTAF